VNPSDEAVVAYRLFISLPLPEEVKAEIHRAQHRLQRGLPEQCARWTRSEQLHLTLRFLGKVDVAQVAALSDAIGLTGTSFAPLKLRAERIGCFPNLRVPRVVWIGVGDVENQLANLAEAVVNATAAFSNEAADKKFTGHITIARIRNLKRPEAEILAELVHSMRERVFGEWTADTIELVRSQLSADGARHSCVARLPLRGVARQVSG